MRLLILSGGTGGGHNSCARALAKEADKREIEWEIKDSLDFCSQVKKEFLEKGHSFTYRHLPKAFSFGYEFEDRHSTLPLYIDFAAYYRKVYRYILENGFDTVVCTHMFPSFMLKRLRDVKGKVIRQYFVATDYTCSPGVDHTKMDKYFIPFGLTEEFLHRVPKVSKLLETGIPVDADCYEPYDKAAVREELGLPQDKKIILISFGSMGCGNVEEMAQELLSVLPQEAMVIVICGTNEKLLYKLRRYMKEDRFYAIGFTRQMLNWMRAADMIVAKPGGLTSTEIVTVGLPFIIVDTVPGLEGHNRDYLVERGCAVTAKTNEEVKQTVLRLLSDEEELKAMRRAQKEHFSFNSVAAIFDYMQEKEI